MLLVFVQAHQLHLSSPKQGAVGSSAEEEDDSVWWVLPCCDGIMAERVEAHVAMSKWTLDS
jgi:hypothetical protein